jgi:hypothetical protein
VGRVCRANPSWSGTGLWRIMSYWAAQSAVTLIEHVDRNVAFSGEAWPAVHSS